jgi:DNA repair protein RadC
MKVRLTPAQKIKILNADDLYVIMRSILLRERKIDRNKEHFWLVCLANNNRILLIELISFGSVNATTVEPMDVFSFALQKRAVKLIMVHNHPSGELQPSPADRRITDKMAAIGKFVNVPVIDHLIISETGYYSFAATGLLKKIEDETHYDLTFAQIDRLLDEKKGSEKKKAKEIAKKMKAKGMSVEMIVELTGLKKVEIGKL